MKINIYDTTLRDGAQGHGITFSIDDKLQIIRLLDGLGTDFIEVCNFDEAQNDPDKFFEPYIRLLGEGLSHASLAAFGSTCRPHEDPRDSVSINNN